jgi:microcompartment protein CcmL/EutN
MNEALALIELRSLARGLRCLDALVKKAPVEMLEANLVEPGRYLLLFTGGVAEVEESFGEALSVAGDDVVDQLLLPRAHPRLLSGLRGAEVRQSADEMDCLGVIEGLQVASTLRACDRSLKDADVTLSGLRVTGGLGGKAYYVVFGAQHDVEAAIEAGTAQLGEQLCRAECIARPHEEMVAWLLRPAPFRVG